MDLISGLIVLLVLAVFLVMAIAKPLAEWDPDSVRPPRPK